MRQSAPARLIGRPRTPKVMSPISGPQYNRLIAQTLTFTKPAGPGLLPVKAPKPSPPKPLPYMAPKPKAKPKEMPVLMPTPIGRFKTHADAEQWAKNAFPEATVDVSGIPLNQWNIIANEIDYLAEKFPGITKPIKQFGATDGPDGAIAWTNKASSVLQFDRKEWSNSNNLHKAFKRATAEGWHSPKVENAGPAYYVTHEMGHLVDLRERTLNAEKRKELLRHFQLENGQFDPSKGTEISEYAATNEFEAAAEAFAAARWRKDKDNPIVNQFREAYGL